MSIKSFAIRSARKLLDHLDTEPRLLLIETDEYSCPMHAINNDSEEIAGVIRSWIGHRYDVAVVNGDIKLTPKKNDK